MDRGAWWAAVSGVTQSQTRLKRLGSSSSSSGKKKPSCQCRKVKRESEVAQSCLLATPWTAAHQAPPSMGFSRHEYWSGVPLPSPIVIQYFNRLYSKFPTSAGSLKKQESSRKTSISALLTVPKPLTVWITINCGTF